MAPSTSQFRAALFLFSSVNMFILFQFYRYAQQSSPILFSSDLSSSVTKTNRSQLTFRPYQKQKPNETLSILNDSERIKYYMGKWFDDSLHFNTPKSWESDLKYPIFDKSYAVPHTGDEKHKNDIVEMKKFMNLSNNKDSFMCEQDFRKSVFFDPAWLDHTTTFDEFPIFVKARDVNNNYPIPLQVLHYKRHWGFATKLSQDVNQSIDRLWNDKLDKVVWRGANSGKWPWLRLSLAQQYFNHSNKGIDVGFHRTYCGSRWYAECIVVKPLRKDKMKNDKLLRYKYLVSMEGNDAASNLKWLLTSNSCVMMPVPTKETWAMEGLLKPYVHYVPLTQDQTSGKWDLEEQFQFCLDNDEMCNQIAQNGKRFILENKFLDIEHEMRLQQEILDIYCQQYTIM